MKGVIIVLGATNDNRGNLSPMALGRVTRALDVLSKNKDYKLLLTGGFGWNFNRTNKPHWFYLKEFFLKNKVSKTRILGAVSSRNTYQDFLLLKQILESAHLTNLIVVTSGFHMPRVRLLCRRILGSEYTIKFVSSRAGLDVMRYFVYLAHEVVAIVRIYLCGLKSFSTKIKHPPTSRRGA